MEIITSHGVALDSASAARQLLKNGAMTWSKDQKTALGCIERFFKAAADPAVRHLDGLCLCSYALQYAYGRAVRVLTAWSPVWCAYSVTRRRRSC